MEGKEKKINRGRSEGKSDSKIGASQIRSRKHLSAKVQKNKALLAKIEGRKSMETDKLVTIES